MQVARTTLRGAVGAQVSAGATSTPTPTKRKGFDFYHESLGSPKYIVAPMVDGSELAWRILSRRYGATLCYSPMIHARLFAECAKFRANNFSTCDIDRPLIVQFCANDPETLLEAARHVENDCDGVDINLGCPQKIAKRGNYGAYLQDDWDTIEKMVSTLHEHLKVPVTCKIRIFDDVRRTVAYAQMLEGAGCQMLAVHGRTREQKGHQTGLANWSVIKKVRESVRIPVISNGNILSVDDANECIRTLGVHGVMSAEPNLYNPCIFSGVHPPCWLIGEEYVRLCMKHPPRNLGLVKGHLFKVMRRVFNKFRDLNQMLAQAEDYDGILKVLLAARSNVIDDVHRNSTNADEKMEQLEWIKRCELAMSRPSHERLVGAFEQRRGTTDSRAVADHLFYYQTQSFVRPDK